MTSEEFDFLERRTEEVQPIIEDLVQNLKAVGKTQPEILREVSFALIHEGYRLCELKEIKINTNTQEEI